MDRTRLTVAGAALAAALVTVGAVVLTSDPPPERVPRPQPPPLFLELGTRTDAEARALRRASTLYERRRFAAARAIFERYDSVEARVGLAYAWWPEKAVSRLRRLPESGVVQLHLGIAYAADGQEREARAELRRVERVAPDSPYTIRAEDFLHPEFAPGLPFFVASREPTGALREGIRLQRLGRRVSARRAFDRAVQATPNDPEALTAAAVGRFDKDEPAAAFARLGPLTRRFPGAQTVRFHLGLLLLWIGDVENARRQLGRVRALDSRSRLGKEAKRFLDRLPNDGSS